MPEKCISKSIRLTQQDYDFIMSFRGESFSEKLDNLLKLMYRDVPELQAKVTSLERSYRRSWEDLRLLNSQVHSFQECVRGLENMRQSFVAVGDRLAQRFPEELKGS